MILFSTKYCQHARKQIFAALLLFPLILLLSCAPSSDGDGGGGGSSVVRPTSIPVTFNGVDSGYKILVFLANYSQKVLPSFGPDGDAEFSEQGGTLTVRFHPTNRYSDTGGHGAPDQYFLYVGLLAPPVSLDADGNVVPGGMPKRKSIKGQNVNFTGEFRFDSGEKSVRKHFYLTPALIYFRFGPQDTEFKQIAFNDYGGLEGRSSDTMYFDFIEFSWSSGWHNVYWGDWWDDATCAPDPNDPSVPSEWIPFDMALSDLSDRAVALGNSMWNYREAPDTYFNTDEVEIWAAQLGPEYQIGEGELVFSVRNLNLSFSPR
jgi:hypothetical protein